MYASNNNGATPTPFHGAPPAPTPLQRGGGAVGNNNMLYASRDSLSGSGGGAPGMYGSNNNGLYASRDSLSGGGGGSAMYDSRFSNNGAGVSSYGSNNGYGGGGYAPPRGGSSNAQHPPRSSSEQGYREAEAVL